MQVWCGPAMYEGDPTLPHMPWDHAAYLAPINTGGGTPAGGGGEAADFGPRFSVRQQMRWFSVHKVTDQALGRADAVITNY